MDNAEVKVGMPVYIMRNTHEGARRISSRLSMEKRVVLPHEAKVHSLHKGTEDIWVLDVMGVQVPYHHTEFEPA
jgi:hypothetical protein